MAASSPQELVEKNPPTPFLAMNLKPAERQKQLNKINKEIKSFKPNKSQLILDLIDLAGKADVTALHYLAQMALKGDFGLPQDQVSAYYLAKLAHALALTPQGRQTVSRFISENFDDKFFNETLLYADESHSDFPKINSLSPKTLFDKYKFFRENEWRELKHINSERLSPEIFNRGNESSEIFETAKKELENENFLLAYCGAMTAYLICNDPQLTTDIEIFIGRNFMDVVRFHLRNPQDSLLLRDDGYQRALETLNQAFARFDAQIEPKNQVEDKKKEAEKEKEEDTPLVARHEENRAVNQPKVAQNQPALEEEKSVVLLDRDTTLVDDNEDVINPTEIKKFFYYFLFKGIPIGVISAGALVEGYQGDRRLKNIRPLYPSQKTPGYFIGKGLTLLERAIHSAPGKEQGEGFCAFDQNSLEINLIEESSKFQGFHNYAEMEAFLISRMVPSGIYDSNRCELSYTDSQFNATFKVKINPNYIFDIQLKDPSGQPGLVVTINLHELLKGGYKEIGEAKGKIYGCLQVLSDMHILPILDKPMLTVGIVAITGPRDYTRVNISKVVMIDDEDIIVQNLGRAGMHTILADTRERYDHLIMALKHTIDEYNTKIQKCDGKIQSAPLENNKASSLKSCIGLLNRAAKIYQEEEVEKEYVEETIKQFEAKSKELRELYGKYLSTDADRLDRHIKNLNLLLSGELQSDSAIEMDIRNFRNRANDFTVDVERERAAIEQYKKEISGHIKELNKLQKAENPVFNTYLDSLAQCLGFRSAESMKELFKLLEKEDPIWTQMRTVIEQYSPLINLEKTSLSHSFFKGMGNAIQAVSGKKQVKAKLTELWETLVTKENCFEILFSIRDQKATNGSDTDYIKVLEDLERICVKNISEMESRIKATRSSGSESSLQGASNFFSSPQQTSTGESSSQRYTYQ